MFARSALAALLAATCLVVSAPDADASSRIRAVVNKVPITDNDVRRRAAFLKLRRLKGNLRAKALDELIDEQIQMNEARRLGVVASDKEVEAAFKRFAANNKIPLKLFTKILARSGATPRGFKRYIRARMSWQRAVAARYGREAQRKARPRSFTEALQTRSVGGEKSEQVTVQQIVFVVPKAKRERMARRRKEANAFRQRFPGCARSVAFARGLRDVSVIDKGRMLVSALPRDWQNPVKATAVGKATEVKDTEKGVELLAVCDRRLVSQTHAGPSEDVFQKEAPELDKKYMAALRKKAKIVRR